jgi:hypothetical protein
VKAPRFIWNWDLRWPWLVIWQPWGAHGWTPTMRILKVGPLVLHVWRNPRRIDA